MHKPPTRLVTAVIITVLIFAIYFFRDHRKDTLPIDYQPLTSPAITIEGSAWTGFGVPGAGEVSVQGDFAYVAPGEGDFQVIDIKNKNRPANVGFLGVDFQSDVRVEGEYAYLKSFLNKFGILVVDVADPANPKSVHPDAFLGGLTWTAPEGTTIGDFRVRDGYVYLTLRQIDAAKPSASAYDFLILNAKDPLHITEVSGLRLGENAFRLYLHQNYAYVGFIKGGTAVVDISIPQSPVLKGMYREKSGEDNSPYLLGHAGSTLLMATWQPAILHNIYGDDKYWVDTALNSQPIELLFVDASEPLRPMRQGTYRFLENQVLPWQAVALDNYIYVIDQRGLEAGVYSADPHIRPRLLTFAMTNQQTPKLLNQFIQKERSHMNSLTRQGNYLYINEFNYGMRIFSMTDRAQPRYVGGTPTASDGRYVWVNDDETFAYLMDSWGGTIWIIDVSNKAKPVKRGYYWNAGAYNPYDKFVGRRSFLYVPGEGRVVIIDVSNPEQPALVAKFPGGDLGIFPRITLAGHYAYVSAILPDGSGSYEKALFIYDITQPRTPILKSRLSLIRNTVSPRSASSPQIAVDGHYAYLMLTDEHTLLIVDIANPKDPQIVGRLEENKKFVFPEAGGEHGGRLAIAQGHAYILTGEDYYYEKGSDSQFQLMHIVDVRNPSQPIHRRLYADFTDTGYLIQGDNQPNDLIASGKRLYLGSYSPLTIYDLSDPLNPRYLTDSGTQGVPSPVGYYGQHTGWSLGRLMEQYLYAPTLQGLHIFKIEP